MSDSIEFTTRYVAEDGRIISSTTKRIVIDLEQGVGDFTDAVANGIRDALFETLRACAEAAARGEIEMRR